MTVPRIGMMELRRIPRVVGTITREETLRSPVPDGGYPCDIIELRLDMIGATLPDWRECAQSIESAGYPVLLTLRLKSEGGQWDEPDVLRKALIDDAFETLSVIDIECRSALCEDLCRRAGAADRPIVVSFHDFEGTPPLAELQRKVEEIMRCPTAIPKIVTMVSRNKDIEILRRLLSWNIGRPMCVLGMGNRGRGTRTSFPALGSCLTYGFIDETSAPGQISAAELVTHLRENMPAFNSAWLARRSV